MAFIIFLIILASCNDAAVSKVQMPPLPGASYTVGPTRTYKTIQEVTALLIPGDLVIVDGDASYSGQIDLEISGTESKPIIIRGVKVNGKRPVLSGGKFGFNITGHYNIIEGFEIKSTTKAGIGHFANGTHVIDCVIHDNLREGIIGWGSLSGSITVEYSELYHNGINTSPNAHQIYMATDEAAFPSAIFRLQHCYIHDGNGGNNVKSRSGRNEIYYNWIESASYHGIELIGFDPDDNADVNASTLREDGDVVGNVILASSGLACARVGGDKIEAQSYGRFRFVNNTFIMNGNGDAVRVYVGIETVEFHNNLVYNKLNAANTKLFNDADGDWLNNKQLKGSNNWIQTGTNMVPTELTGSISGTDPGFVDINTNNVKLAAGSPLINTGNPSPATFDTYPFPLPLDLPFYSAPYRSIQISPAAVRPSVGIIDIGAYEFGL